MSDWETYDRPATGNDLRAVESVLREAYVSRRERIATAVLAGLAVEGSADSPALCAQRSLRWADALIAELDK